jgi:tetratricopeptide (TPR) repeat protein
VDRIAATVLECAGSDRPLNPGAAPELDAPEAPVHSESLYAHFNFGWRGLRSWEAEGWRLVVGETERLYHVAEDPAERVDLASRESERVRMMRADLEDTWAEEQAAAFAVTVRELEDDETDALESLGYLSSTGDASTIDRAFREGPDPEHRIRLVELVNLGVTQLAEGHERAAIDVFEEVLGHDPKNRLALEYLGRSYRNLRNLPRARDAFARAVSLGRNPVGVYLDLAVVEIELGNREGAWRALEDALIVQPNSVPARQAMSEILVGEGRSEEALPIVLEAVQLRPRAAKSHLFLGRVYQTLGRDEDAVAAWEEAARLDPSGEDGARALEALRLLHGSGGGTR